MSKNYTNEKHAQIVLALLKEHGIKKIVVSPGSTNIPITASVAIDDFFEVFSCVDERSAAYLACGLSEESGEPVVISCTGATASRNYMSGLTEAYYKKLPVLALTSFNGNKHIGNLVPQNLDRNVMPNDVKRFSVQLPIVKDEDDEKYCNLLTNKALLELKRAGGGPVHINLTTTYANTFTEKKLPDQRVITRFGYEDKLKFPINKKTIIFIGSHKKFREDVTRKIEEFCSKTNSIVLCDHTSSYKGKYSLQSAMVASNFTTTDSFWEQIKPDTIIHIGEVSGDYPSHKIFNKCTNVWRISEDGEIRDFQGGLRYVYEGSEASFFKKIMPENGKNNYFELWASKDKSLRDKLPSMPFSNPWIASMLHNRLPKKSYANFGILNSLRSWNFFPVDHSIDTRSNVGGFGIDGCLSTTVGASLCNKNKLHFSFIGDLAFFYDMNVLGNRHVGNNLRVLLVNNGSGVEFSLSTHFASQFGQNAFDYIAAGGHFNSGNNGTSSVMSSSHRQDHSIAKSWCESNGFEYLSAKNKEEFNNAYPKFLKSSTNKSIVFECFTDPNDESKALIQLATISTSTKDLFINTAKRAIPADLKKVVKDIFGKS